MKSKYIDIVLLIIENIISFVMLVLFSNMELALTIQIILFFLFFLYLVIKYKRRNIDYKIIISYVVIVIIEFLIVYLFSSKFNLIIKEDFSNLESSFGVFSYFMINVFSILILVFTNLIKLCIKKIKD